MDAPATVTQAFVSSRLHGLLQLGTQRHHREPFSTPAVGTKRSSQADHTDRTAWAHHVCLTTTTLATCYTVWNSSWAFSCTRLYTVSHRRTSPTTVCWWRKSVDACEARTCVLPRTWTHFGDKSFAVAVRGSGTVYTGSIAWHYSIYSFRKQLKTFLFSGMLPRIVYVFVPYKYSYLHWTEMSGAMNPMVREGLDL